MLAKITQKSFITGAVKTASSSFNSPLRLPVLISNTAILPERSFTKIYESKTVTDELLKLPLIEPVHFSFTSRLIS